MIRTLIHKQWLPVSLDKAWNYFATPANLQDITPEDMTFEIISPIPDKMYQGLIILYVIRPFANIPMRWCTEITHIQEHRFFVDNQKSGPYKMWHHEHHFEEKDGGVLMTDILHYDIGKSFLGWIAGALFVHKKVQNIFTYRKKRLEQIFSPDSPE